MARSFASILVLLAIASFLPAQMSVTGNCELLVQVRTSDDRNIETPVQVQVLSSAGVVATTQVTGDDAAHFRVNSGRTYRLNISGTAIESVTTSYFEVNPLESTHTETVHVKLANEKASGEPTPGAPTISVVEMNIPKDASSEMKKGLQAYSKGDMQKATVHFQKAVADYPRYARAYDMLGVIALKQPDRTKARELFSKSIQVDNASVPGYIDLARMDLQDQNYGESESLLQKAISLDASLPEAVALLATTEFANREYEKALADVQRTHALPNHEQFAEVHLMAGKVLAMQNRPDDAIAQYQLFLKEKPDSPQAASVRQALTSIQAQAKQQ